MRAMGSSIPRMDAPAKTTGEARYSGDVPFSEFKWLHVVFADVPHARIRSLDVSAAANSPGVVAVLTDTDVPCNSYGIVFPDQPVLCGPNSTEEARTVRWVGDKLCLIVADSKEQAEAAARKVRVDFDHLPVITDPQAALMPEAPRIPGYSDYPIDFKVSSKNVLHGIQIRMGDIAEGMGQADVVVSDVFNTHMQEHAYLEPEAGSAWKEPDGRIAVHTGGQWMHDDRKQIAWALGQNEDRIKVSYAAIGGSFGGKEDVHMQVLLALAAYCTGYPVRGVWTRTESIKYTHKRHPFRLECSLGARRDGTFTALRAAMYNDAGPYASVSHKVLGNAALSLGGCYNFPHAFVDGMTIFTNNTLGGAFRGFGSPQAAFAMETLVNRIAVEIDMDPIALRLQNAWQEGALSITQTPIPPGCMAREVLVAARQKCLELEAKRPNPVDLEANEGSLTSSARRLAFGRGVSTSNKNVGIGQGKIDQCHVWLELHGGGEIEEVWLGTAGADCGQGAHSAFKQIAAEQLNVDVDQVHLKLRSTDDAESSGSASASRLTYFTGAAIEGATQRALQAWEEEERPARGEFTFVTNSTALFDPETGTGNTIVDLGYCAQIADISVDLDTGHITVLQLISANDVGRAVNPQQIEGQIEGAVAQGIGWTLYEEFQQADGKILNPTFSTYLIPGVKDVPDHIVPVIVEGDAPNNPLNVKGMAEMALAPVAPAIVAALHDATGIWMTELPLTPENVWRALQKAA